MPALVNCGRGHRFAAYPRCSADLIWTSTSGSPGRGRGAKRRTDEAGCNAPAWWPDEAPANGGSPGGGWTRRALEGSSVGGCTRAGLWPTRELRVRSLRQQSPSVLRGVAALPGTSGE